MSDEVPPAGRVRELLGFPDSGDLLRVLHDAGVGRDGLLAALLPGKLRMGMLHPADALEAVAQVDAFLAERRP